MNEPEFNVVGLRPHGANPLQLIECPRDHERVERFIVKYPGGELYGIETLAGAHNIEIALVLTYDQGRLAGLAEQEKKT